MLPFAESEAVDVVALNAAVTATVGLAIGLVTFPVRWGLQWSSRRRHEDVIAYREALRLLRTAQLDNLYAPGGARSHDTARDAALARAWAEAQHVLSTAHDNETYKQVALLADLTRESLALATFYPPEAGEDPRDELSAMGVELLTHKIKHRWTNPVDQASRLSAIRDHAEWAKGELADQHETARAAYQMWLEERGSDS